MDVMVVHASNWMKSEKATKIKTLFNARDPFWNTFLYLFADYNLYCTECHFCKPRKRTTEFQFRFSNRLCLPTEIVHFPSFNFSLTTCCSQICSSMTIHSFRFHPPTRSILVSLHNVTLTFPIYKLVLSLGWDTKPASINKNMLLLFMKFNVNVKVSSSSKELFMGSSCLRQ